MKEVVINKHKLELYDSIDELPIKRFHVFNRLMLVDAGVGCDVDSLLEKISRIIKYIELSDKQKATIELNNLRQAFYLVSNELNAKHLAFFAFVKSINGEQVNDVSEEGLKRLQTKIEDVSISVIDKLLQAFKKKIDAELDAYFYEQFNDVTVKEYHDRLKTRVLLELKGIVCDVDVTKDIDAIDSILLNIAKPKPFSGRESAEIQYDKQFENMCLMLSSELSINSDTMTVLQFYNAFEYLKKQRKNGR